MGDKVSTIRYKVEGTQEVASKIEALTRAAAKQQRDLATATKVAMQQQEGGVGSDDAVKRAQKDAGRLTNIRGMLAKEQANIQERELANSRKLLEKSYSDSINSMGARLEQEAKLTEKAEAASIKAHVAALNAKQKADAAYAKSQATKYTKYEKDIEAMFARQVNAADKAAEQEARAVKKAADRSGTGSGALSGFGGKMVLGMAAGRTATDITGDTRTGQEIGSAISGFMFGGPQVGLAVAGMELIGSSIRTLRENWENARKTLWDYNQELANNISLEEGIARRMVPVTEVGKRLDEERQKRSEESAAKREKWRQDRETEGSLFLGGTTGDQFDWLMQSPWKLSNKLFQKGGGHGDFLFDGKTDRDKMFEQRDREQKVDDAYQRIRQSAWEGQRQAQVENNRADRTSSLAQSQFGLIPAGRRGILEAELNLRDQARKIRFAADQEQVEMAARHNTALMEARAKDPEADIRPMMQAQARERVALEKETQEQIVAAQAAGQARLREAQIRYRDETIGVYNDLSDSQVEATKVGYDRELSLLQNKIAHEKAMRDADRADLPAEEQKRQAVIDSAKDAADQNREKARSAEFIFGEHERLSPIIQLNEYRMKLQEAVSQNVETIDDARMLLQRKITELWSSLMQPHEAKVFDSRARLNLYAMDPMRSQMLSASKIMANQMIPGYADGTDYHPGGTAWVGEHGPELVHLPRGSSVTPEDKARAIARKYAGTVGTSKHELRGTTGGISFGGMSSQDIGAWWAGHGHHDKLSSPMGGTGEVSGGGVFGSKSSPAAAGGGWHHQPSYYEPHGMLARAHAGLARTGEGSGWHHGDGYYQPHSMLARVRAEHAGSGHAKSGGVVDPLTGRSLSTMSAGEMPSGSSGGSLGALMSISAQQLQVLREILAKPVLQ